MIENSEFTVQPSEWWVQRWLELLDSYRFKKRLERARIYAREGNVLSIEFQGAQVLAKVQGSEAEPYQVSLSLALFSDEDWEYVIDTLSQKAIFSAQLLAGEMPETIESVFTANGLSLFPFTLADIRSRCSCPDKANPCKHIGAVYYQLGDRFSEEPFVLFQLRGRTKDQILEALRQRRRRSLGLDDSETKLCSDNLSIETDTATRTGGDAEKKFISPAPEASTPSAPQTGLPLERFWQYHEPLDPSLVVIVPPPDSKTVLDVLGRIPLPDAEAQIVQNYLEQLYQLASQQAVVAALHHERLS
jgi:uncharacterized Zn finger protein